MILEIAVMIFLVSCSYVVIQIIPELKKALTKENSKNYITNIYSQKKDPEDLKTEEIKTEKEEKNLNVEEKLNDIFVSPSLKNLKTNFKNLGESQKSKKINKDDLENIRKIK